MTGVIIVTGGSRGIGAAVARLAGRRKHVVCITYVHDQDAAKRVIDDIVREGGHAIAVRSDVAVEGDITDLFHRVDRELGPLSALVNNAGTSGSQRCRVEDMTATRVNTILGVNLAGTILCSREAIRRMSTRHGGRGGAIVNVSSAAARLGAANLWMDYAAAKGGVDCFTTGLAIELADEGIRVNAVRPGLIDTDIHAAAGLPERIERAARHLPMKRAGQPEEVAAAVLWLLSPEASYVSGAIVDVAGAR